LRRAFPYFFTAEVAENAEFFLGLLRVLCGEKRSVTLP
jgi:hypothetical protein